MNSRNANRRFGEGFAGDRYRASNNSPREESCTVVAQCFFCPIMGQFGEITQ